MDFNELADTVHKQRGLESYGKTTLLAFDPGHTTGWAAFIPKDGVLEVSAWGEIDCTDIAKATKGIATILSMYDPHIVVMEDYRVYSWRAKHHAGSNLLTARVIGCIETLACMSMITRVYKQPANIAKKFCTDTKLREWGFYQRGSKHVNDAIRHGCYFLIFGPIKQSDRDQVGPTVG